MCIGKQGLQSKQWCSTRRVSGDIYTPSKPTKKPIKNRLYSSLFFLLNLLLPYACDSHHYSNLDRSQEACWAWVWQQTFFQDLPVGFSAQTGMMWFSLGTWHVRGSHTTCNHGPVGGNWARWTEKAGCKRSARFSVYIGHLKSRTVERCHTVLEKFGSLYRR